MTPHTETLFAFALLLVLVGIISVIAPVAIHFYP